MHLLDSDARNDSESVIDKPLPMSGFDYCFIIRLMQRCTGRRRQPWLFAGCQLGTAATARHQDKDPANFNTWYLCPTPLTI